MTEHISPASLPPRLTAKITVDADGCWLWTASIARNGYGLVWHTERRVMVSSHRLVWELVNGAVPEGLDLDHLCRVRRCCNPDHLEPVSRTENNRRGTGPSLTSARLSARTHCANGHPYGADAPRRKDHSGRRCRECSRLSAAAYRERQRAS